MSDPSNPSNPSNPITEPKRRPSQVRRAGEGLLVAGLGAAAWVLFFLISSLVHIRFLPLPVIGLLMIAAGLYWAFSRDRHGTGSGGADS
ncbi:hypothetical protein [Streptacidiphilus cavernicola]|uniref:DUF2530 domain-containing protein n=1 Tax=Streptacidiphilus cavernicola TaxID=3342716 RepID=A0ABV6VXD2_9ACTN